MRVIVFACIAACAAPRPRSPSTASDDARSTVIELFRRYDVVGMPELHGNEEVHEFLRELPLRILPVRILPNLGPGPGGSLL